MPVITPLATLPSSVKGAPFHGRVAGARMFTSTNPASGQPEVGLLLIMQVEEPKEYANCAPVAHMLRLSLDPAAIDSAIAAYHAWDKVADAGDEVPQHLRKAAVWVFTLYELYNSGLDTQTIQYGDIAAAMEDRVLAFEYQAGNESMGMEERARIVGCVSAPGKSKQPIPITRNKGKRRREEKANGN